MKLTPRQAQILDLIRRHMARTGLPPTRQEIAAALGFRSPNAAEEHLRALARKGAIELLRGTSRGIRLLAEEAPPGGLPVVGRVAAGFPILAQEHRGSGGSGLPPVPPPGGLPAACSWHEHA